MESVKVKLITYNVGDKSAEQNKPDELFSFAQSKIFDFIFIGLQEVISDSTWTALIKKYFGEHDYVLVKVRNIWAIWIYALVKRSRLSQIGNVESEVTASGYGGVMGNKGGASIRFRFQGISLIVVNGHFTPHEEGFKDRLNDYLDIVTSQSFRDSSVENILDHDIVFWLGDLNFRLEDMEKDDIEMNIKNKNYSSLIPHDQLIKAIQHHNVFKDFKEGDLHFAPTFKFDDDCDTYDTSKKKRKPAWTDRILYLVHNDDKFTKLQVNILKYYSEPNIRGSDHRPVCAEFQISFNPPSGNHDLPIEFTNITEAWNGHHDQVVTYRSLERIHDQKDEKEDKDSPDFFRPDRWDWIGLVPSTWSILADDMITYVYVSCTCTQELSNKATVEFNKRYLNNVEPNTNLQLIYFSKRKNCIQGISNVFSFV